MIYGTASYYRHLRFEPAASEQAAAVDALRPPETSYTSALGAALTGAGASRRRTSSTGTSGKPGTPGKPARA
jgi:hypothetical protein